MASLLKPGVVVRAHPGERREFLPPQATDTPPRGDREPHLGRLHPGSSAPQKLAELSIAPPGCLLAIFIDCHLYEVINEPLPGMDRRGTERAWEVTTIAWRHTWTLIEQVGVSWS
jgi:hypothetical protein